MQFRCIFTLQFWKLANLLICVSRVKFIIIYREDLDFQWNFHFFFSFFPSIFLEGENCSRILNGSSKKFGASVWKKKCSSVLHFHVRPPQSIVKRSSKYQSSESSGIKHRGFGSISGSLSLQAPREFEARDCRVESYLFFIIFGFRFICIVRGKSRNDKILIVSFFIFGNSREGERERERKLEELVASKSMLNARGGGGGGVIVVKGKRSHTVFLWQIVGNVIMDGAEEKNHLYSPIQNGTFVSIRRTLLFRENILHAVPTSIFSNFLKHFTFKLSHQDIKTIFIRFRRLVRIETKCILGNSSPQSAVSYLRRKTRPWSSNEEQLFFSKYKHLQSYKFFWKIEKKNWQFF